MRRSRPRTKTCGQAAQKVFQAAALRAPSAPPSAHISTVSTRQHADCTVDDHGNAHPILPEEQRIHGYKEERELRASSTCSVTVRTIRMPPRSTGALITPHAARFTVREQVTMVARSASASGNGGSEIDVCRFVCVRVCVRARVSGGLAEKRSVSVNCKTVVPCVRTRQL